MNFSESYQRLRETPGTTRDKRAAVPEMVVQCVWYDHLFSDENLRLDDKRSLRVISPGWWNHSEGPDFKGAQLEIAGKVRVGDVEIHLTHTAWKQHGHHRDRRYDEVILVVVLEAGPPRKPPQTSAGRRVPTLLLQNHLTTDIHDIADALAVDDYPFETPRTYGDCAALANARSPNRLIDLLELAGEWRMLNKAQALRERMARVGAEQAAYEAFLTACGFARFKREFQVMARELPYERVRQLAREDPALVETAYLIIAGLLPDEPPGENDPPRHWLHLNSLARARFSGLRPLPLTWNRVGVRPLNYPERRLAGAARFIARTAAYGFLDTLDRIWRAGDEPPVQRRRAFEALFPNAMGFWAEKCAWTGRKLARPTAPIGHGRIRSIIGNVFVPVGLARARQTHDRVLEERVRRFFAALPQEPPSHVQKIMTPRLFGDSSPPKSSFRVQQGTLQLFRDWCEPNPSCQGCAIMSFLDNP